MSTLPDAVAARLLLGRQMRAHRERAQLSRPQADALPGLHGPCGATSLELGVGTVWLHDLIELCALYGLTDIEERRRLVDLAQDANAAPGWWEVFSDVIPPHALPYLGWEQAAAEIIWTAQPAAIPDLLHADAYARAALQLAHPGLGEADLDYRHALVLKRQERLRSGGLTLVALLSQTALTGFRGDRRVLFRQLEHLQDLCDHPGLTLQITPSTTPLGEPVALAYLPDAASQSAPPDVPDVLTPQVVDQLLLPDLAYLPHSTAYLDQPADALPYARRLAALATRAPPARQTPLLLKAISRGL